MVYKIIGGLSMKVIKYSYLSSINNIGTEENPIFKEFIIQVKLKWNESNELLAKREAYKGEYVIEEEEEEPVVETLEERTAALEEALTLLLEGATE